MSNDPFERKENFEPIKFDMMASEGSLMRVGVGHESNTTKRTVVRNKMYPPSQPFGQPTLGTERIHICECGELSRGPIGGVCGRCSGGILTLEEKKSYDQSNQPGR